MKMTTEQYNYYQRNRRQNIPAGIALRNAKDVSRNRREWSIPFGVSVNGFLRCPIRSWEVEGFTIQATMEIAKTKHILAEYGWFTQEKPRRFCIRHRRGEYKSATWFVPYSDPKPASAYMRKFRKVSKAEAWSIAVASAYEDYNYFCMYEEGLNYLIDIRLEISYAGVKLSEETMYEVLMETPKEALRNMIGMEQECLIDQARRDIKTLYDEVKKHDGKV